MRLLVLTPFLPYGRAPHAVASTVHQWLRRIAERHEVDLISFVDSPDEAKQQDDVREFCSDLTLVHRRVSKPALLYRVLRHPSRPRMHWAFHDRRMVRAVRERTSQRRYDLVQVEYSQMAQYGSYVSQGTPRILVKHDVRSIMAWRAWKNAQGPSRAYALLEWLKTPGYELDACQQFDAVVTLSAHNQRLLQGFLPDLFVEHIPPGIDTSPVQPERYDRPGQKLIFFGNMADQRNVTTVLFLYHEILPLVRQAIPTAQLHIVGANPTAEVQALSSDGAVAVTGYVDDARAYFASCDVSVAPMQVGGGILLKVLETMACGLPVVATSIANEGIEAHHEQEILIADKSVDFANQVIRLLEINELRRDVGMSGLRFVQQRFGWGACIDKWEALYEGVRRRAQDSQRQ